MEGEEDEEEGEGWRPGDRGWQGGRRKEGERGRGRACLSFPCRLNNIYLTDSRGLTSCSAGLQRHAARPSTLPWRPVPAAVNKRRKD